MPVYKCPNGKYRIGSGECIFDSKAKAEVAYRAYLAKKHSAMNEILNNEIELSEKFKRRLKCLKENLHRKKY